MTPQPPKPAARLERRRALVTGGGQGVGRGIALALAAAGAHLVVAGRTESKLVNCCEEIAERGYHQAIPLVCDVGDGEQVQACVANTLAALGGLDILVNNAHSVPLGRLLEVDDKLWDIGMGTGPLATFRFMKAAYPALCESEHAAIINLGSSSALRWDTATYGVYAATKEAVRALTRAAANEWGSDGIRANCVLPIAMSPGMEWWCANNPEESKAFLATVPLGRVGDCETDIGHAVAFLCSDDARYITGQSLLLDGGQARLG